MPRSPRCSEEGDGNDDVVKDGDEDGSEMQSEAAYEEFEEKWMDYLGYSTSNFTKDSEEEEEEYCCAVDED